jgi:hypothetical protein
VAKYNIQPDKLDAWIENREEPNETHKLDDKKGA